MCGSRLGLLSGWCRCSSFVTQRKDDPAGVFRAIRPGEEAGTGLAPACWPDQKPVRPLGRDSSQSCRQRFSSPDRHRSCPPTWAGGRSVMLADQLDFVVGVDSHRDTHAVAVVAVLSGVVVFEASDRGGQRRLRGGASACERHAPGRRAFAIEGTASYRRRPDAIPARARRAGVRGRPSSARAPLGRQDRRARRDPGRAQRAHPEARRDAAQRAANGRRCGR